MKLGKKHFILSLLVSSILPISLLSSTTCNRIKSKHLDKRNVALNRNSNATIKLQKYDFIDLIKNNKNRLKEVNLFLHNDVAYIGIKEFLTAIKSVTNFQNTETKLVEINNKKYKNKKVLDHFFKDNKVILKLTNEFVNESNISDKKIVEYTLEIDFRTNKINVSNYKFFIEILKDYRRGEEELEIDFLSSKNINSQTTFSYDLKEYGIDILKNENDLYLPLVLLNQLFLNESNYQTYFNGEIFNLFNYTETLSDAFGPVRLKSSKANNEQIPTGLKEFQYKYFSFLFDYYYGIKLKDNKSYKEFISVYENDILGEDDNHYLATKDIINDLGDLHSSFILDGYYNYDNSAVKYIEREFKKTERLQKRAEIENELGKRDFGKVEYSITYTPDRKTAIISFRAFDRNTTKEIQKSLEIAKNQGVKNIVFNVTVNTGGYIGSAYEIMGFMTDKPFYSYLYNPLTKEKRIEEIKSKYPKYDFNYFILTSPYSFSAANIFPQMAKDNNVAKVIGYKTFGGASAINYAILPTGDIIQLSSNNVFTDKNFNSIELGVKPDIPFEGDIYKDQDKLYNLDYIESIVNKETNDRLNISHLIKNTNLGEIASKEKLFLYEEIKKKNNAFNLDIWDIEFHSLRKLENQPNKYEIILMVKDNALGYHGEIKLFFSLKEEEKEYKKPNRNPHMDTENTEKIFKLNKQRKLVITLSTILSLLGILLVSIIVFLVIKIKKRKISH
ncbi:S41 family peptidase [Metamycoplasma auris]|uniref:Peptidase S41-like protein n=1 Tax=Metamycoplasma auris TaxID=51363 RepID=A0A2W7G0T1_9BACT|nr:S41 family peptidase [Metamycoplasma auris]PZV99816.1 peptidase S41-like protein [Metamycoplasma auris]